MLGISCLLFKIFPNKCVIKKLTFDLGNSPLTPLPCSSYKDTLSFSVNKKLATEADSSFTTIYVALDSK